MGYVAHFGMEEEWSNITSWSAQRVENKVNPLIFCSVESRRAREKIEVNV